MPYWTGLFQELGFYVTMEVVTKFLSPRLVVVVIDFTCNDEEKYVLFSRG